MGWGQWSRLCRRSTVLVLKSLLNTPVRVYNEGQLDLTFGAVEEFIREGENGHILSPFDRQGWRETLKMYLHDGSYSQHIRTAAGPQTPFPTWDDAADRFKQHLVQFLR